ncbi:CAAD domain-containing protein [Nostoc sp. CCY0012]|uniref:CAAD domain-containing protein n=1 Tax=Nostoc sp. CCY0012 TaxID=1056123 RepID=UPI0039C6D19B
MELEQQQLESVKSFDAIAPGGLLAPSGGENAADLPKLPPASEPENQWQQTAREVSRFLTQIPEYLSRFFNQNQRAVVNIVLVLTAIITVKVILAVLDAINDIPLLSPLFELTGIGYSTWFTFRYLLKAETRQELTEDVRSLKHQILGVDEA